MSFISFAHEVHYVLLNHSYPWKVLLFISRVYKAFGHSLLLKSSTKHNDLRIDFFVGQLLALPDNFPSYLDQPIACVDDYCNYY